MLIKPIQAHEVYEDHRQARKALGFVDAVLPWWSDCSPEVKASYYGIAVGIARRLGTAMPTAPAKVPEALLDAACVDTVGATTDHLTELPDTPPRT
jgi:hypothetical protein